MQFEYIMASRKHHISLQLDIPSNCLALIAQQWGILIKPILSGKQLPSSQPVTCDPADVLSAMVSQFLVEKNFEQYLEDKSNYQELCNHIKSHMNPS
jgi:hypothetical protein